MLWVVFDTVPIFKLCSYLLLGEIEECITYLQVYEVIAKLFCKT